MRLIDFLVKELENHGGWPEGYNYITQDSSENLGSTIYAYKSLPDVKSGHYWLSADGNGGYGLEIVKDAPACEDARYAIITKAHYESALVQDNNYLPSPGEIFEYGSHRTICKCLAVGEYYVFASKGQYNPEDEDFRYEEFMITRNTAFYPFDGKRDETIKALSEVITRSSAIAVYDKVQRNEVPGLALKDE